MKSVQELATHDSEARNTNIKKFSSNLDQLLAFRNKEQVGEELVEAAMKELFEMIEIMLRAVQSHTIGGGVTGMTIVLKKYNNREFEV